MHNKKSLPAGPLRRSFSEASRQGFTLVELLIVLAIISILASIILASVRVARLKAFNVRAQADGNTLKSAIMQLEGDTSQTSSPGITHTSASPCIIAAATVTLVGGSGNHVGLSENSVSPAFPNWNGPYLVNVPTDPWNRNYFFDTDAVCAGQIGCSGLANPTTVRAIYSQGSNTASAADDIFTVLCR
ncbi:MAG: prepilin-type N-terminal cleavage/methylation domain-containing protein [bacterium]|nr:prepilin-type N-terminal cleavage/methylation domain-containing protein [bacterium]